MGRKRFEGLSIPGRLNRELAKGPGYWLDSLEWNRDEVVRSRGSCSTASVSTNVAHLAFDKS